MLPDWKTRYWQVKNTMEKCGCNVVRNDDDYDEFLVYSLLIFSLSMAQILKLFMLHIYCYEALNI